MRGIFRIIFDNMAKYCVELPNLDKKKFEKIVDYQNICIFASQMGLSTQAYID